ncbi:Zinc-type alcohol dehydrogenase-like protein C2E1P3.01 [Schizosaccharomyces pombe]|uniref:Zinc-type alcohol dehydrogenase-like protein C2E1P3.01 n=1 Tax=Schizosaccharomyces pombe (strain 972 / ATCC 24843) TaxID=284812 RepID=YKK1_SCHPO|nr:putative dehydrogenase [Schizosaccharomyces pombe]Q9P7F4.1 RecName: Full=Zinc-type alcohol dehydrogenase-like protein C2E1P3.01 [Schizosaccharomyces pombe 972h-]CAB83005.1 dehydrogenase (predicted) [Schizosaccharomyces pombe]|eukprot:NP_593982.1 putative dehydrogenase [Schizosaccharomyces pombe]
MKAVIADGQNGVEVISDAPKPTPEKGEFLGRVIRVAFNPIDWKTLYNASIEKGTVGGTDFVAVVEDVGEGVDRSKYIGATVSGWAPGPLDGSNAAWREYITLDVNLVYFVPKNITPSQAATLPLTFTTASQGLNQYLGLPLPPTDGSKNSAQQKWVLVWSGSSSVGQYVVQLAHHAGYKVIATCSPHNFDWIKKLGADFTVDYHDPNVVEIIKKATDDSVFYGFDAASFPETSTLAVKAFSSKVKDGKLINILSSPPSPRSEVKIIGIIDYSLFNREFNFFGNKIEPIQASYDHAVEVYKKLTGWLQEGVIIPNRVKEFDGGLQAIPKALREFASGKHSAVKFVVRID